MDAIVIIAIICAAGYAIYFLASLITDCDPVPIWVKRMFGAEVIWIREQDKVWRDVIRTDPWGQRYAYRHPTTKIGEVLLNPDGTGKHIWNVKWTPENRKSRVIILASGDWIVQRTPHSANQDERE